jgi:hypothetical protein
VIVLQVTIVPATVGTNSSALRNRFFYSPYCDWYSVRRCYNTAALTPARSDLRRLSDSELLSEKGYVMKQFICEALPDPERRAFFTRTAAAAAAAGMAATAGLSVRPAHAETPMADKIKFMQEANNLAIESVEKGWGGPFGAVIVKDGEIIGRGQNRVDRKSVV